MKSAISTDRLLLRRWHSADLEPFVQMNQDPVVMEYFPRTLTPEERAALIGRIEAFFDETGFGLYALELRSTGEFIGFTGLSRVPFDPWPWPSIEIGWRLKRAAWGKGYAAEAGMYRDGQGGGIRPSEDSRRASVAPACALHYFFK
jgi:RimJ/RimL family protein N-acetyltransferase